MARLQDYQPQAKNANKHTPRGLGALGRSIEQDGWIGAITVAADGETFDGSARIETGVAKGFEDAIVIESDGTRPIVHIRTDIPTADDPKAKRLGVAANRVASIDLEWDTDVLSDLRDEGLLDGLFFDDELDALLAVDVIPGGGGDEFDTTPQEGDTRVKRGDVWRVGEHRLMCGDSTSADDVARLMGGAAPILMVTDPPYGVEYTPEWRNALLGEANRAVGKVANDDRASWREAWALFTGDVVYCWHASLLGSIVADDLSVTGLELRSQIIWAKQHFALSRGHYHWQHECCWYAVRKGRSAGWNGGHKQTTLWEINNNLSQGGGRPESEGASGHGTQKPIECMERPIRNHGGDVYDPFLGSGTTLIAAHRTGRKCYGMEIEPKYCDVILRRAEAEGIGPIELVGEGGGMDA